jgi:S-adenosylmethionine:tRNA ribosyltransferase-isomerase
VTLPSRHAGAPNILDAVRVDELDFDLPRELIATEPARPRDTARLLVVHRSRPGQIRDLTVRDLPSLLTPDDTLVFNATRVLPARFEGTNLDTGGSVSGLFLAQLAPGRWSVFVRARRHRPGRRIALTTPDGSPSPYALTLVERDASDPDAHSPAWLVELTRDSLPCAEPAPAVLDRVGRTALPPYILSARRELDLTPPDPRDREDYQTVYARADDAASVAAPTAGLHFTPELLDALAARGVGRAEVLLHVGAGTFKPVEADRVEDHPMHAEWCSRAGFDPRRLPPGQRLIAVGTTTARTLESFASLWPDVTPRPEWLSTRLLITPGYTWRAVDGLLTNFHLPRSTLLAMVAALFPRGMDDLRPIYQHAIGERYRFFSFGDAMLILP